jgi:hypothetical protein
MPAWVRVPSRAVNFFIIIYSFDHMLFFKNATIQLDAQNLQFFKLGFNLLYVSELFIQYDFCTTRICMKLIIIMKREELHKMQ